jgi:hypothetical protein
MEACVSIVFMKDPKALGDWIFDVVCIRYWYYLENIHPQIWKVLFSMSASKSYELYFFFFYIKQHLIKNHSRGTY